MKPDFGGPQLKISLFYRRDGEWIPIPEECWRGEECQYRTQEGLYYAFLAKRKGEPFYSYEMGFEVSCETQLKLMVTLEGGKDHYHVIPCNIYGSNHAEEVRPGEFPLLTEVHPEIAFCSPYWEFRADRAAVPLSALCWDGGVAAVSICPYSEEEGQTGQGEPEEEKAKGGQGEQKEKQGQWKLEEKKRQQSRKEPKEEKRQESQGKPQEKYLRNGVFAALPGSFGVTLGYTNDPVTFLNRTVPAEPTQSLGRKARARGRIYLLPGEDRTGLHRIVRMEYEKVHSRACYEKSFREAALAMLAAFCHLNYDKEAGEYTNRKCRPPEDRVLKPWRNVTEIGWTGGAILAYPLVMSRHLLGEEAERALGYALSGEAIIDRIIGGYNEKSGLLYDLAPGRGTPSGGGEAKERLNGWWTYYGLCKDCHCAYTQGSAVSYILKTVLFLKRRGISCPDKWLEVCRKVLDTVTGLQREDGAFGYTYSPEEKKVLDWEGFAGCWFVPGLMYLARLTGESAYAKKAEKGLDYYQRFVYGLDCYGAPMDTWKAVDQEGNLSFLHGSRLLYEYTGKKRFLEYMKQSAGYEFLWRYCYPTRPENAPLKDGWNACGGSVTSVSNPHIHPMGVLADEDLLFLTRVTGDDYYSSRAHDSIAWMMQTLELYPEKTGYGQYGVLSERWCPSDGLVTERSSDGAPYSSWFSYNLWAAANVFEAVLNRVEEERI